MSSDAHATKESVKETLISILIAFVLAFVARSFVAEAFIIPTGSMAPTLLGAHMKFTNPETGETWPVGPWFGTSDSPDSTQRSPGGEPLVVHDPVTGMEVRRRDVPCRAGDRIMVLKYLYALREPDRFDVVVFKNPDKPGENFIKRLVGLPGEQVALVDGDVFTRATPEGAGPVSEGTWNEPGWKVQRKPVRVQKAVWQRVYDSSVVPANSADPRRLPWAGQGSGWQVERGGRSYLFSGSEAAPGVLVWRNDAPRGSYADYQGFTGLPTNYTVMDRYPYNEGTQRLQMSRAFPVSDLRLRASVEPVGEAGKLRVTALMELRRHQFRAVVENGTASLQMRPSPSTADADPKWTTLGTGEAPALRAGDVTIVDVWHYDQSMRLFIDGREVCGGTYDWTPAERIAYATGASIQQVLQADGPWKAQPFADPARYTPPQMQWQVAGGSARLGSLLVERDLHYQPATSNNPAPPALGAARATHPTTTMTLAKDQFFVCGDNSPASSDSRLWAASNAWVQHELDPTLGVVPRRLLLGKAFFVYFPALVGDDPIPVPDFGRMRFIQ